MRLFVIILLLSVVNSLCSQNTFFVKEGAVGSGKSWENAAGDLNSILKIAKKGDQIWVAAGTYKPTSGTNRTATFRIPSGVKLYGGFQGTEKRIAERQAIENASVLSGEIGEEGIEDNSFTVVTTINVSKATLIDGFIITGGSANRTSEAGSTVQAGGGWFNMGRRGISSPVIRNTLFINNYAKTGGAFYNLAETGRANPDFFNCFFINNSAEFAAGGLYNESRHGGIVTPKLTMCIMRENSAGYGAAIYNFAKSGTCSPEITDTKIEKNTAAFKGGSIFNTKKKGVASPKIRTSRIEENKENTNKSVLEINPYVLL